jgi:hypothetical protein
MPGKKGKTIKAIIAGKLSKWFESIEKDPDKVNTAYLIEIIDRIF